MWELQYCCFTLTSFPFPGQRRAEPNQRGGAGGPVPGEGLHDGHVREKTALAPAIGHVHDGLTAAERN